MPRPQPTSNAPAAGNAVSPRTIRIVRWSLVALAVMVLLLVFAVPQKPPPPPSLAQPDQAFVDRVGIVSPGFARTWAGALLNDDRAQIVVYVERALPDRELAEWAIQTATDWKIGTAKNDTGLVLFVFTEPRLARIDVGYGLEDRLTDARTRQLLETHLAPAFSEGQYERGLDALIFAIRKELGGDDAESIHARAAEDRKSQKSWFALAGTALKRSPQLVTATIRRFLEEGPGERFAILVFVTVGLGVAAFGLGFGANTVWRVVTLPARLRAWKTGPTAASRSQGLTVVFEIVVGAVMFGVCLSLLMIALLTAEGFLTRKGAFSGAGAAIVWPAPPR